MQTRLNNLRQLRQLAGIQQWALAAMIGRSQGWVCLVETGQLRPAQNDLAKVAAALGVDAAAIGINPREAR